MGTGQTKPPAEQLLQRARQLLAAGDLESALQVLQDWVWHSPRPVPALTEFGRVGLAHGRLDAVLESYARIIAREPPSALLHFNYAWHAFKDARADLALEHYSRALELGIDAPHEVHRNLANVHQELRNDDAAAEASLREALRLQADFAGAWFNLGNLHEQAGRREAARDCFNECLRLDPRDATALARLAETHRFSVTDSTSEALLKRMTTLLALQEDVDLRFAVGRAHEQRGEHAQAWEHYSKANAADHRQLPIYRAEAVSAAIDDLIATSTPAWLRSRESAAHAQPIFICGMFRSGSTLLEQMLAAHPLCRAGGERQFIPRWVRRVLPRYPQGLQQLSAMTLADAADRYGAEGLSVMKWGAETRVTDKRPDNFLYLGLIKAMFPRAKILVTERDWRDIATSVFATRLGPAAAYATDLKNIRHYIFQQQRLLSHWRTLFGEDLLTVKYESLVEEPRATLESVLAALGLKWDERVLEFHRLQNSVRTASVWQVREPLHRGSIGRWQRFSAAFAALD